MHQPLFLSPKAMLPCRKIGMGLGSYMHYFRIHMRRPRQSACKNRLQQPVAHRRCSSPSLRHCINIKARCQYDGNSHMEALTVVVEEGRRCLAPRVNQAIHEEPLWEVHCSRHSRRHLLQCADFITLILPGCTTHLFCVAGLCGNQAANPHPLQARTCKQGWFQKAPAWQHGAACLACT